MAKKKMGRPATGRTPAYTVYVRVKPEIGKALEAYLAVTEPTTTQTAAVELALKRFLIAEGYLEAPQEPPS